MPRPDPATHIDQTDAKAGSKEGVVRWVLLISLGLAILALTIIWVTGALTQDNVEGQQNLQRREQAQQDMVNETETGAGDLAEEGGMISPNTAKQPQPPAGRAEGVAPNAD